MGDIIKTNNLVTTGPQVEYRTFHVLSQYLTAPGIGHLKEYRAVEAVGDGGALKLGFCNGVLVSAEVIK